MTRAVTVVCVVIQMAMVVLAARAGENAETAPPSGFDGLVHGHLRRPQPGHSRL